MYGCKHCAPVLLQLARLISSYHAGHRPVGAGVWRLLSQDPAAAAGPAET
jgi:hypothetical protein